MKALILLLLTTGFLKAENDLNWHNSYKEALAESKASGKPLFLAFR